MSAERWRSSRVCVGLHSAPVSRSLDKEMGATRVVVVIFLPRRGVREARRGGSGLRGCSRNGFWSFCENELEETEKFANLRAGDDEWRQEAQGEIVRAIDHQALAQSFGGERIAIDGKLDAQDQAFAANFADEIELGGELGQARAEFGAACADIFEELFIFDDGEELKGGGADQRTSAKGCAVQAGTDAGGYRFVSKNRAEGQASGQRLGDQDDVGLGGKLLVGEVASGAAEATLDFVGDEKGAMLGG